MELIKDKFSHPFDIVWYCVHVAQPYSASEAYTLSATFDFGLIQYLHKHILPAFGVPLLKGDC